MNLLGSSEWRILLYGKSVHCSLIASAVNETCIPIPARLGGGRCAVNIHSVSLGEGLARRTIEAIAGCDEGTMIPVRWSNGRGTPEGNMHVDYRSIHEPCSTVRTSR